MSVAALELQNVSRAFFGVPAVADVSLSIRRGRILGLIGQNGAGKSTLMNIVGGVLHADTGAMMVDDEPYAPADPRDAGRRGIGFIHQELNLFPNLSIAENIFIDGFPRKGTGPFRFVDRKALRAEALVLLKAVSLEVDPDTPVERLAPGERQLVEVAKALQLKASLLIFDEPTTSLTARETAKLFALIKALRAEGRTIIYISHILADVSALADDIAVLRDGRLAGSGPVADFPVSKMINLMLGRDIDQLFPPRIQSPPGDVLLSADRLSTKGLVKDISFELRAGEVLGLFGLMGSGRTELARMLFGLEAFESGEIVVGGARLTTMTPRRAIGNAMAFVTENRREEGLLMNLPIAENIGLAALPLYSVAGAVDVDAMMTRATEIAGALSIKSGPIATQPAKSLSGGNQQKVVIAKWLMTAPRIFIVDEPTRGVDVAAKYEIYAMIRELAAKGSGILFISSEIEEVTALADRLLVMSRGEIVGRFESSEFDRETILRAAFREEAQVA